MPNRLTRIYDDEGPICQLNQAAPGVIFDVVTGNPLTRYTDKWFTAVERLSALHLKTMEEMGPEDAETLDGAAARTDRMGIEGQGDEGLPEAPIDPGGVG